MLLLSRRKYKGQSVELTGVLQRGKDLLPLCFRADMQVC